jgi:hypothetical protein
MRILDQLAGSKRAWRYAVVATMAFILGGAGIVYAADPARLVQLVNFAPNPDGSFNTAQVDSSHQLSVADAGTQARLDTANRSLGQLTFDTSGNLRTTLNGTAQVTVTNSSIPVTQSGGSWTTQSSDATTVIASGANLPLSFNTGLVSDFDFTPYKEVQIYAEFTNAPAGTTVFNVTYKVGGSAATIDFGFITGTSWTRSFGLLPQHTTILLDNEECTGGCSVTFTVLGRRN